MGGVCTCDTWIESICLGEDISIIGRDDGYLGLEHIPMYEFE